MVAISVSTPIDCLYQVLPVILSVSILYRVAFYTIIMTSLGESTGYRGQLKFSQCSTKLSSAGTIFVHASPAGMDLLLTLVGW